VSGREKCRKCRYFRSIADRRGPADPTWSDRRCTVLTLRSTEASAKARHASGLTQTPAEGAPATRRYLAPRLAPCAAARLTVPRSCGADADLRRAAPPEAAVCCCDLSTSRSQCLMVRVGVLSPLPAIPPASRHAQPVSGRSYCQASTLTLKPLEGSDSCARASVAGIVTGGDRNSGGGRATASGVSPALGGDRTRTGYCSSPASCAGLLDSTEGS
jgi:hypothetical protein